MNDAPWIQIVYRPSSPNGTKGKGEVTVDLTIAPHQVPKAVRGYFDPRTQRTVIEFRYADDEEFKVERQDDRTSLRFGRYSRRLMGLELNISGAKASKVQLKIRAVEEIEHAVRRLIEQHPESKIRENYSIAMKAIDSKMGMLSSEMLTHA
jgi:hypothetical protein